MHISQRVTKLDMSNFKKKLTFVSLLLPFSPRIGFILMSIYLASDMKIGWLIYLHMESWIFYSSVNKIQWVILYIIFSSRNNVRMAITTIK